MNGIGRDVWLCLLAAAAAGFILAIPEPGPRPGRDASPVAAGAQTAASSDRPPGAF